MTWLSNPKTSWISRLTSPRATWIERQEAAGKTSDNSFPVHDAYEAIYFLEEFAYQTRGE